MTEYLLLTSDTLTDINQVTDPAFRLINKSVNGSMPCDEFFVLNVKSLSNI